MTTLMFRPALKNAFNFLQNTTFTFAISWSIAASAQSEEPFRLGMAPPSAGDSYVLSEGVLETSETYVGPRGRFDQLGGAHRVQGALQLEGGNTFSGGGTAYAFYTLAAGNVRAQSIQVTVGVFTQTGGTNEAVEFLIGPHNAQCSFQLSGGSLTTLRTTLHGSWLGGIRHSGGTHTTETLGIIGDDWNQPAYAFTGGGLNVADILIQRGTFRHENGTLIHTGIVRLESATWEAFAGELRIGALQLGAGESRLKLGANAKLWFANSAGLNWNSGARLIIENWNGSLRGGGSQQVGFGPNNSSLSPQQLGQIFFKDPAGCPLGVYPARILASGELAPGPYLETTFTSEGLRLQWDAGFVLQCSTNVSGPFVDVHGAVSPLLVSHAEAQCYFRLRK